MYIVRATLAVALAAWGAGSPLLIVSRRGILLLNATSKEGMVKKRYDPEFTFRYHRKSTRLKNHNYGWSGTYFITINANTTEPIFEIPELHRILLETWHMLPKMYQGLELDEFVIMPDHVHFIIKLEGNVEKPSTLGGVVGGYKSITTNAWLDYIKEAKLERSGIIWHRSFYDEVIFDATELASIREYIRNNPEKLKERQRKKQPVK